MNAVAGDPIPLYGRKQARKRPAVGPLKTQLLIRIAAFAIAAVAYARAAVRDSLLRGKSPTAQIPVIAPRLCELAKSTQSGRTERFTGRSAWRNKRVIAQGLANASYPPLCCLPGGLLDGRRAPAPPPDRPAPGARRRSCLTSYEASRDISERLATADPGSLAGSATLHQALTAIEPRASAIHVSMARCCAKRLI
jgi:hypothetical protein